MRTETGIAVRGNKKTLTKHYYSYTRHSSLSSLPGSSQYLLANKQVAISLLHSSIHASILSLLPA